MNTSRIIVISLVTLALGILLGVGFQGSISQILSLNAAPAAKTVYDIWNTKGYDYVPDPRAEAAHLANIKDGLLHSAKLRIRGHMSGNTDSAADGYMRIYDPTIVEQTVTGGTYTNWKWEMSVFTGCFNSAEEDRIKAIMQSSGKGRDRAILDVMVELASQNKDDRLIKLTLGNACVTDTGLNR